MLASWAEDGSIPDACRLWPAIPEQSLYPVDPIAGEQDFSDSAFRELTAGDAKKCDLLVVREPDNVGDSSHAVIGRKDQPGARLKSSQAAKLKKASKWADLGPGQFPAAPPVPPSPPAAS